MIHLLNWPVVSPCLPALDKEAGRSPRTHTPRPSMMPQRVLVAICLACLLAVSLPEQSCSFRVSRAHAPMPDVTSGSSLGQERGAEPQKWSITRQSGVLDVSHRRSLREGERRVRVSVCDGTEKPARMEPLPPVSSALGPSSLPSIRMQFYPGDIASLERFSSTSADASFPAVLKCNAPACPALSHCGDFPEIRVCSNPDLQDDPLSLLESLHNPPHRPAYADNPPCLLPSGSSLGKAFLPNCPLVEGGELEAAKHVVGGGDVAAVGWLGQVFVLQDVYVDEHGRVFNETHRFDIGGCGASHKEVRHGRLSSERQPMVSGESRTSGDGEEEGVNG